MEKSYNRTYFISLTAFTVLLFVSILFLGPVSIPATEIFNVISGSGNTDTYIRTIILESRLPMACSALFGGAALSVAGLIMQTLFQNPLAGPSILGISSGASLGVALLTLAGPFLGLSILQTYGYFNIILGAVIGAILIVGVLAAFSASVKNSLALLIIGILISYLCSAIISLLNFFAPAHDVKTYVVWGLGSFSSLSYHNLALFCIITAVLILSSLMIPKYLDAFLLGDRYAGNMGYSIKRTRSILLILSGLLTGIITAFCGPISFIGLVFPHVARLLFRTSSHAVLIPASILFGAIGALICAIISVLPSNSGIIPVNAITPIFGVPIIIYLLIKRKDLPYFN